MTISRRQAIKRTVAFSAIPFMNRISSVSAMEGVKSVRTYHLSLSIDAIQNDPGLLEIVKAAGVTDLWLSCFFQGSWHPPVEEAAKWHSQVEAMGFAVHQITIPLGHPTFTKQNPDYMPQVGVDHWKPGVRPDGRTYYGVSLHSPITEHNVVALEKIKRMKPGTIFLDDDFRLAPAPGDIGGCFCEEHKQQFLQSHGYSAAQWDELITAVNHRQLTPLTRAWVEWTCDQLTQCFRAQQKVLESDTRLGIMVMYLGSEKAGIRLSDYKDVPFRVGEGMFDDNSFNPVKGKTNELFSCLFHRRYTTPELAFSETTAWPPDKLSAANMAAKLTISTIADVRNTMFMSGLVPFPRTHWSVLGPVMKKNAALHDFLAGQQFQGPFKHSWGERSRYVGDANPYSLFLALGVPFETTDDLASEGWTFLADYDMQSVLCGEQKSKGTQIVHRPSVTAAGGDTQAIGETLEELFTWRRSILPQLKDVPYIVEEIPVVCAWYPSVDAVLVWNLADIQQQYTLCYKDRRMTLNVPALDCELVKGISNA